MSDAEAIEAVVELINDYGVGLRGDLRERALNLIREGQFAAQKVSVMAEQADYALRYRNGEDMETLRRTMTLIIHHSKA